MAKRNVLRVDPSRTGPLRMQLYRLVKSRFSVLRKLVRQYVETIRTTAPIVNSAAVLAPIRDAEAYAAIRQLQSQIHAQDLIELEPWPHVTIKYGFTDDQLESARKLLTPHKLDVRLGKLATFEQPDRDVLYVTVISPELAQLNSLLGTLPNSDARPEYRPHITVAYLQKGSAQRYLDSLIAKELVDKVVQLSRVHLSPDVGRDVVVTLNDATNAQKVREFTQWLRKQMRSQLSGRSDKQLWEQYVKEAYKKGASRTFDDVRAPDRATGKDTRQAKQEFLRSSFSQGATVEKVKRLVADTLGNLDESMADSEFEIAKVLADGLAEGKHPVDIGKDLEAKLGWAENKAQTLARTSIMRAHAESQLDAMEAMGVQRVGVAVEWATADDDNVCEKCAELEGIVLKLSEARGMLPRHPNCRCAWLPSNVGEDDEDQVRGAKGVRAAVKRSKDAGDEDDDWDVGEPISSARPMSALRLYFNKFCPTGKGGGVDPSCGSSTPAADKQKFIGKKISKLDHVQAKNVEDEVAAGLGGAGQAHTEDEGQVDKKPYDVKVGKHAVEVKSLLKGGKQAISVHPDALMRKVRYIQNHPDETFHTVVVDERNTYEGGQHSEGYSGHRIYYKRGSGRYSLSKMHKVKDMAELKRLIKANDDALPDAAKGKLPPPPPLRKLAASAKQSHDSRLRKDRARKARLKAGAV